MFWIRLILLWLALSVASSAQSPIQPAIDFVRDIQPIFEQHCYACHGPQKQKSGLRLDVKSRAFHGGDHYGPMIDPSDPKQSPLLDWVKNQDPQERMPPAGPANKPLSSLQVATLEAWIVAGAPWPDGIDKTVLLDPKSHWSFQPLATHEPHDDPHVAIDTWIESRLAARGLSLSLPATPMQWLRRVTLDLHGLPPDAGLAEWFVQHHGDSDAYQKVVEQLLASPRYAERWAQHWLDVVRYADTHGFEVNTERPHAWHYRDYVIRALENDTPFDQFIREQIAGDQLGQDTATGFLITASVLLPGQIGADEPSKRLARQDAIDEIVVNLSQSFLGLSIGCARCHDHKFDPITQEDYYAMQAFVAGVDYEDRLVDTPWANQQRQLAEGIVEQLRTIDRELLRFENLAHPQPRLAPAETTNTIANTAANSAANTEAFAPQEARWVKLEIWNANLHPTLGLIEPCIDEFEIWTHGDTPRNVALAAYGTQVTASGSRETPTHQLKHIHDGKLGNGSSWMSDQAGRGWVLFELPQNERISKIVWGRDRLGEFLDRTATAYRIQLGIDLQSMRDVVVVLPKRPMVQASINSERIAPMETRSVRFSIHETNQLEPCIDEFEIFNPRGENIALRSNGTRVTSTGDSFAADRHELRLVNDGSYGNSRSWMSNQTGKGSLTFEFSTPETIERVVWGRDRQGQFQDRLAIRYTLEVLGTDGQWIVVADESDRVSYSLDPAARASTLATNIASVGLTAAESNSIETLQTRQKQLQNELKRLQENQKAFSGRFRTPDTIHLLLRGDPEQPKQMVAPKIPAFFGQVPGSFGQVPGSFGQVPGSFGQVPGSFGQVEVAASESEPKRRMAIADWIASPANPLTARVIANRIWQGHFGIGLVDTPNDFGLHGQPPTHPELLDWLAAELIAKNWSLKSLHRAIVLSKTYGQSSQANEKGLESDADCRLMWRYPLRRLEAEAIRDSILAVSGQLNTTMFGRGYDLFAQRGGLSGFQPIEQFEGDGLRRMIYAHKVRREREAVFGAFDCPDAGQSTGLRRTSMTPIQALNLLNSAFTIDQSKAFAERLHKESGTDTKKLIQRAYQRCLFRDPTPEEISDALPIVQESGLESLCRALFNCNEFLFLP
ncbi:MAG: PSD1 and planctomycete cytochrome C domain-containing protein [Planctomycetota bacterium]|nr:PSD1 and planctomycete cytochrome C domain-containing protein [Planctomycetota bacterium]